MRESARSRTRQHISGTLTPLALASLFFGTLSASSTLAEDWPQLQGNALRSGNAPRTVIQTPLGLMAAIPTTDAVLASPVVSDGKAFVVDGSGVVFAIDTQTLNVVWKFSSRGGAGNCNNVAAPAVVGRFVHVGTMAGYYYVLDRASGAIVKEIDCGEPVFTSPAVGEDRVYFATLRAHVYAVEPNGEIIWTWDFVKEVVGFEGNRWKGQDWVAFRGDRVTWRDHFVCSRDICLVGNTVVMPAGGRTVFLEDVGEQPKLRVVGEIPAYAGNEFPATFGQSADEAGNVYVQWHRRDNAGRVEIMRLVRRRSANQLRAWNRNLDRPAWPVELRVGQHSSRPGLPRPTGARSWVVPLRRRSGRGRGALRGGFDLPGRVDSRSRHLWWT